jgi:hypothetical protein
MDLPRRSQSEEKSYQSRIDARWQSRALCWLRNELIQLLRDSVVNYGETSQNQFITAVMALRIGLHALLSQRVA